MDDDIGQLEHLRTRVKSLEAIERIYLDAGRKHPRRLADDLARARAELAEAIGNRNHADR
jgi:hypothetical protein